MEINNSSPIGIATQLLPVDGQVAARRREQTSSNDGQTSAADKRGSSERFDIDAGALRQVVAYQRQTSTQRQASNLIREYDQPSRQNLSAVARYQTIDNLAQREVVTQTFGVDLYA